jgi:hypothetical protein
MRLFDLNYIAAATENTRFSNLLPNVSANASTAQSGLSLVDKRKASIQGESAVDWSSYPRLMPGNYPAYCKRAKWYWDPGYKHWVCLLLFDVLSERLDHSLGIIPMWFGGGNGKRPKAGRRTNYFPAWVRANGKLPIRKDRLSPCVFVRRMALVKVGDTKGPVPYSVVREIIEWTTGSNSLLVTQSRKAKLKYI